MRKHDPNQRHCRLESRYRQLRRGYVLQMLPHASLKTRAIHVHTTMSYEKRGCLETLFFSSPFSIPIKDTRDCVPHGSPRALSGFCTSSTKLYGPFFCMQDRHHSRKHFGLERPDEDDTTRVQKVIVCYIQPYINNPRRIAKPKYTFVIMSHSAQWQAEQYKRENRVILYDVPALLNEHMQSCVLESNEYQNTHDEYMHVCCQLKDRISQLHYKIVALGAVDAFLSYPTNARRDTHETNSAHISSAIKLRLHHHASLISLAVARQVRENKFCTIREHVQTLKNLQNRHDLALDQLHTRVKSHLSPDCL